MVFALMLTDKQLLEMIRMEGNTGPRIFRARALTSFMMCLGVLEVLLQVVISIDWTSLSWMQQAISYGDQISGKENMVENIGINLMTRYLLPFEVISVFLLAALIGAAYLARGRKTASQNQHPETRN